MCIYIKNTLFPKIWMQNLYWIKSYYFLPICPFSQFLPFLLILRILRTPMGHPMALVHHFWVQAGVWSIVALISSEISRIFSFFFIIFCPFLPFCPISAIFAHFAHFAHPYGPPHGLGSSFLGTSWCVKYSCIDFKWDIENFFIFFHYFLPIFAHFPNFCHFCTFRAFCAPLWTTPHHLWPQFVVLCPLSLTSP